MIIAEAEEELVQGSWPGNQDLYMFLVGDEWNWAQI